MKFKKYSEETQIEFVCNQLVAGNNVTSIEMFEYGITRLSSIIHQLRNDTSQVAKLPKGKSILTISKTAKNGAVYGEYQLITKPKSKLLKAAA